MREAFQRLTLVHGPGERRAVLLALLKAPDSAREQQAWAEETASVGNAGEMQALVQALPDAARLPLFEAMLQRSTGAPQAERTELLRSARRVMCADGKVRPLDRLHWLLMRHSLAQAHDGATNSPSRSPEPALAEQAISELPDIQRRAIASVTAYLARLVPAPDKLAKVSTAGGAWYRAVLSNVWLNDAPICRVPDADELVHALGAVQALSWVQRPVLARTWVQAALQVNHRLLRGEPLSLAAAQALRITTRLLDSPLHPALAERFLEVS